MTLSLDHATCTLLEQFSIADIFKQKDVNIIRITQILAAIDKCPYDAKTRTVILEPWAVDSILNSATLLYEDIPENNVTTFVRRIIKNCIDSIKHHQNMAAFGGTKLHIEISLEGLTKSPTKKSFKTTAAHRIGQILVNYNITSDQSGLVKKIDPDLLAYCITKKNKRIENNVSYSYLY